MNFNYLNEIWKDITGYKGLYQVSNFGRVRSLPKKNRYYTKIIRQEIDWKGYVRVQLIKDNKEKWFKVHRLVAEAFIPNPNNYPQVNHKDENKLNNCVDNLEWCDCTYNNNYGTRNKQVSYKLSKPVIQYDIEGNFIREFNSISEVQNNGFNPTAISQCCKGKIKTSGGYKWDYKKMEH